MSDGIRHRAASGLEDLLNDDALEEARRILRSAGSNHKVTFTLKVDFVIDKEGSASMVTNGQKNMKMPSWDSALNLTGQQMSLAFEEEPPKRETPVVPLNAPTEAASADQKDRLTDIESENEALLERVRRGELTLTPEAEAALKAQS